MSRDKLTNLRGNHSRLEVAQDLEITPQMLGAIERGSRTPSLPLAKKIADYYGVAIEDIFLNMKDTKCVIKRRRNMKKLLVGATLLMTMAVVTKKVAKKRVTYTLGTSSFRFQ